MDEIANEWNGQAKAIDYSTMPLTRMLMTSLDATDTNKEEWLERILSFLTFDLVCYRATEPFELVRLQESKWDPLVNWFNEMGNCTLTTGQGIAALEQPVSVEQAGREFLSQYDCEIMLSTRIMTEATGSAVISMARVANVFSSDELFSASQVDQDFQIERWGADEEASQRIQSIRRDFENAGRFADFITSMKPDQRSEC